MTSIARIHYALTAVAALLATLMLTTHLETVHKSTQAPAIAAGASTAPASGDVIHRAAGRGHNLKHHRRTTGGYNLERTASGRPLRWGTCATAIPIYVDTSGAPVGFAALAHEAFARISAASGLRFALQPASKPVGDPLASGGIWLHVARVTGISDAGTLKIAETAPAFWADSGLIRGVDEAISPWLGSHPRDLLPVLLHETGHAVGLDHVYGDPTSVMAPSPHATRFSRGDLRGLRAVGTAGGCQADPQPTEPTPAPEPITTTATGHTGIVDATNEKD